MNQSTQRQTTIVLGLLGVGVIALAVSRKCEATADTQQHSAAPPPPPPPPLPQPQPQQQTRSPRQAAQDLLQYVSPLVQANELDGLGTRGNPSDFVANAQRDMKLLKSDGIYGPKTAARGKQLLGVEFPVRRMLLEPLIMHLPPPVPPLTLSSSIPSHAVEVMDKAPANALPARNTTPATSKRKPAAAKPATIAPPAEPPPPPAAHEEAPHAAAPAEESKARSSREAARALLNYVSPLIRAGKSDELGTNGNPSDFVANAQRDMKLLKSDGIYGPKTAARGKELLGIQFPSRTKSKVPKASAQPGLPPPILPAGPAEFSMKLPGEPPPPSQPVQTHPPLEAANALFELVTTTPQYTWGTKEDPNLWVQQAQRDMGGGLKADGVYGPKTAARAAKLTGKKFPARK